MAPRIKAGITRVTLIFVVVCLVYLFIHAPTSSDLYTKVTDIPKKAMSPFSPSTTHAPADSNLPSPENVLPNDFGESRNPLQPGELPVQPPAFPPAPGGFPPPAGLPQVPGEFPPGTPGNPAQFGLPAIPPGTPPPAGFPGTGEVPPQGFGLGPGTPPTVPEDIPVNHNTFGLNPGFSQPQAGGELPPVDPKLLEMLAKTNVPAVGQPATAPKVEAIPGV